MLSRWRPTLHYCMQTEAHVYALAIAASVLLSFYPFLIVMLSLCRNVFHWDAAEQAIYLALNDFLPGEVAGFVRRNLVLRGKIQFTSLFLLLFTANGVFEPLEVALNRALGIRTNRSYLKNQLVSLGLIFLCGSLALVSLMLTGLNKEWITQLTGSGLAAWVEVIFFKTAALPISILALFLVFWLLPNAKISPKQVIPVAIFVGLALEALKYVNLLLWPLIRDKLRREYDIFFNSATIVLWSFLGALIVLAGAEWAGRTGRDQVSSD